MTNKRRGFIIVVMILSIVAFAGFSLSPLLSGILEANQVQNQPSPGLTPSASIEKLSDLESQARGYELVLQREPENQTALRALLEVRLELIRLGQAEVEDAIPPLEKLSQLNPDNRNYSILLAQSKEYTGDREGAAQVYRSILTQTPGDLPALQGLASLLVRQERPEAAIGLLQDTIKVAPEANQLQPGTIDVISVQLVLGDVYAQQQRYDEAIAVYEEAAKGDANDFRPVYAQAIVLRDQGKTEKAQQFFAKAEEMAPAAFKDQIKQQAGLSAIPDLPAESEGTSNTPVEESPTAVEENQ